MLQSSKRANKPRLRKLLLFKTRCSVAPNLINVNNGSDRAKTAIDGAAHGTSRYSKPLAPIGPAIPHVLVKYTGDIKMDKKIAGLLGAVGALASLNTAQAATPTDTSEVLKASPSYS